MNSRLLIEIVKHNDEWALNFKAQTNPNEPVDVDNLSFHPTISEALHKAWLKLTDVQFYFTDEVLD